MRAEHPQIQRAAPRILLAAPANFEQPAQRAVLHQLVNHRQDRVPAIPVRDGELHVVLLASGDDFIRLRRRAAKGLLDVDSFYPCIRSGYRHVPVLVHMPHANGDDVRLYLREHRAVVSEAASNLQPLARGGEALRVGIGHRHKFSLGELQPHRV